MLKVFILLILIASNPLFSQESIPIIPLNIQTVESFGYWQNNSEDGFYRIIIQRVGYEHLRNFVYIQLIKSPTDPDSDLTTIDSFPIKEINEPCNFIISDYDFYNENNFYFINFTLLNTYSFDKSEIRIKLDFNHYKILP